MILVFGKIFASIYDGTLGEHWQALVTFQQMIVLCDADGVVDMTPEALSRNTGIPLRIIRAGIIVLESPDPSSRSPAEDGRRIIRLQAHRDWGWRLVNHQKYRDLRSAIDRREYMRDYMRARRAMSPDVIQAVRDAVFRRDGGKCRGCGSTEDLEFDHVTPVVEGGDSSESNVQLLCLSCNRAKGCKQGKFTDVYTSDQSTVLAHAEADTDTDTTTSSQQGDPFQKLTALVHGSPDRFQIVEYVEARQPAAVWAKNFCDWLTDGNDLEGGRPLTVAQLGRTVRDLATKERASQDSIVFVRSCANRVIREDRRNGQRRGSDRPGRLAGFKAPERRKP